MGERKTTNLRQVINVTDDETCRVCNDVINFSGDANYLAGLCLTCLGVMHYSDGNCFPETLSRNNGSI